MSDFHHLIGKYINMEISGRNYHEGTLVDTGLDIIVVYNHMTNCFLYIPIVHIQRLKEARMIEKNITVDSPPEKPIESSSDSISFRKILLNAKGQFVQIYVTGNKSIHGYLTSVMNDYFVFYSPVYKTLFISMDHVKWLVPYQENATPYSLNNQYLPINPTSIPLARTFEEQCKKLENHIVVIDGGDHEEKIGLLQKVRNNRIILVTAERENVYLNIQHIKMIHVP